LVWTTAQQLVQMSSGYWSGYVCNVCRGHKSGDNMHCRQCNYDMCPTCYQPHLARAQATAQTTQNEEEEAKKAETLPDRIKKQRKDDVKEDQHCTARHDLKSSEVPNTGPDPVRCDLCFRNYSAGETFRCCEACDFDVCQKCFSLTDFNPNAKQLVCNSGHRLLAKKINPGGGYRCDVCVRKVKVGTIVHSCDDCDWGVCEACYEDNSPLFVSSNNYNCPGNHGLKRYPTAKSGYSCDVCKEKVEINTFLYGCRLCRYDACQRCFESTK